MTRERKIDPTKFGDKPASFKSASRKMGEMMHQKVRRTPTKTKPKF